MQNKIALLVLAAGIGSRFQGLKQLVPIGIGGETLLEYNLYNAIENGIAKIVFVVSENISKDFQKNIIDRIGNRINIEMAFQRLDDIPSELTIAKNRLKPWGTLHAVLAARNNIDTAFIVINADDFYGAQAFSKIIDFYQNNQKVEDEPLKCAMVGYPVKRTLFGSKPVNRGICIENNGILIKSEEYQVALDNQNQRAYSFDSKNKKTLIADNRLASMNFWGFPPNIFSYFVEYFNQFIKNNYEDLTSECFLPDAISYLIQQEKIQCQILSTTENWFGITYPEDKEICKNQIAKLIEAGEYPIKLWQ